MLAVLDVLNNIANVANTNKTIIKLTLSAPCGGTSPRVGGIG